MSGAPKNSGDAANPVDATTGKELKRPSFRKFVVIATVGLFALVGAIAIFVTLPNPHGESASTAKRFVRLVADGEFDKAHAMTTKTARVGEDRDAFVKRIKSQNVACSTKFRYTFPKQSLGNRIRRAINGRKIEQSEVTAEFTGCALVSVKLKQDANEAWQVVSFASHAG